MPHVRENEPRPDGVEPRDRASGPAQAPEGTLGGNPINAGETAAREDAPGPGGDTQPPDRHPEAVEGEPGSDL
jgi:hypothetical protein